MAGYNKKFVAIDLETTHLDQREGRIMEVGAVEFELIWENQAVRVKFGKTFSSLVNPEIEPSETALMITGIKKEELKNAPLWNSIKSELKQFVGDAAMVGHNIGFDLGYLENQGLRFKNSIFDSLEMARTLLPLESSHALEALAERFAVLKNAPHRALADCQNTALVTAEILNEFLRYPAKLRKEVIDILGRSELDFIHMLEDLPEINSEKPFKKLNSVPKIKGLDSEIAFVDKTIYCYPQTFNQLEAALHGLAARKTPGVIGLSHKVFLTDLERTLVNPVMALCETRRQMFSQETRLPAVIAKILAKIAILRNQRLDMDLSLVKWSPEEMLSLHYFTVDPVRCLAHDCAFVKSLAKKYTTPVFASLETVFELARDWTLAAEKKLPLLLFDLSATEDKFSESAILTWNLKKIRDLFTPLYPLTPHEPHLAEGLPREVETMLNDLDLFFGILHLVYLKRNGEYAENLVVDELERDHERFAKLFHPAEKLKNKLALFATFLYEEKKISSGELRPELAALQTRMGELKFFLENFFLAPNEKNIYWLKFNSAWVDLNEQPRGLKESWDIFAEKFSSVTIADSVLPQISHTYFRKRLGLQDYTMQKCLAEGAVRNIPVRVMAKTLHLEKQIELAKNLNGRTLLLLPNELTLTKIYQSLHGSGTQLLAYKYSGNVPTLKNKLKNFSGDQLLFLLTTHALAKHWRVLPALDNLVVFKLPFEARGSKPALLGLGEQGSFVDTILPRAISSLHRIITGFLAAPGEQKHIFILDPRLLTDYDRSFLNYFEEFPEFTISTD